jgi:hypothetical protein
MSSTSRLCFDLPRRVGEEEAADFKELCHIAPGETEDDHKTPVRIAGVVAQIQTKYVPNRIL